MFLTPMLGRLMLAQKFMILSVVALVLACIPTYLYINEANKNLDEEIAEVQGIKPLADLHRVIQLMQQHRGLAALQSNKVDSAREPRVAKQKEVDEAFDRMSAEVGNIPDKMIQDDWSAARRAWESTRVQLAGGALSAGQSNLRHADLIAKLLDENELIGDYFGLSLDPDRDTYQLVEFLYYQLPYLTEDTEQMRAEGAGLLAQKDISVEDRVLMSAMAGRVRNRFDQTVKAYGKSAGANPAFASALSKDIEDTSNLTNGAIQVANDNIVKNGTMSFPPAQYQELFARTIESQFKADVDASAVLRNALESKISGMESTRKLMLGAMALLITLAGLIQYVIARSVSRPAGRVLAVAGALTDGATEKIDVIGAIADGNLDHDVGVASVPAIETQDIPHDEMGGVLRAMVRMSQVQRSLDAAFRAMTISLRTNRDADRARDWLKTGLNELNEVMRGDQDTAVMADKVLIYLAERLQAGVAVLYLFDADSEQLELAATYAMADRSGVTERFRLGQGVIGQAARDKKTLTLTDVPEHYLPIVSGTGKATPKNIIVLPLVYADSLIGVVELGSFRAFTAPEMDFLEHATEGLAIGFGVNRSRQRMQALLATTEAQTEELRVQQEELQQSNAELEERAEMLEAQREHIRAKNAEVEAASREIQVKVAELEKVSAYKSEFLANMSHELRTPLNSMLILSSLLQKNKGGHLSDKQVEYAATIHGAGKDLLNLINDILDLSKIEAGRLEFHYEDMSVANLVEDMTTLFRPVADHQHVEFKVSVAPGTPSMLRADAQRTQQIVKNLLGNAFKFTRQGQVSLTIQCPATHPLSVPALAIAIGDTGIGIAADKHEQVFHAFQQADGSTSRQFGGTGLGLSISLQLARRMGGDIRLASELGRGSLFTLYLPLDVVKAPVMPAPAVEAVNIATPVRQASPEMTMSIKSTSVSAPIREEAELPKAGIADDRDSLTGGGRAILIVEDDRAFAAILRDRVRDHGFKAVVAEDGESGVLLAERLAPSAIILDVMLPHMDGWSVMRSIKDNPRTRHIPVHFITCLEDRQKALSMGAIGFASKPVGIDQLDEVFNVIAAAIGKSARKLLVVEDNEVEAKSIAAFLEMGTLEITIARTGQEALERLQSDRFDCMVLDLGLSDMSGFDLLDRMQGLAAGIDTPVIVHSGSSLSAADERRLQEYTNNIIVKGAESPERLLNEVSLFLHMVESSLPQDKQKMIRRALDKEAMFERRKVLLVDDDMRNIFSLSSVLAEKGMQIVEATNGYEALSMLEEHLDVDIVLMDIMMPEMDGYEAMRRIRKIPRVAALPIIALTAKAMVGDQKLCLDAGANDYISKPVDVDKLFSLMRVWLYQADRPRA